MRSIKFLRTRINDCTAASSLLFSRQRDTYFCGRAFVYYLPWPCVVMRPTSKVALKPTPRTARRVRRVTLIASELLFFFSSLMLSTGKRRCPLPSDLSLLYRKKIRREQKMRMTRSDFRDVYFSRRLYNAEKRILNLE